MNPQISSKNAQEQKNREKTILEEHEIVDKDQRMVWKSWKEKLLEQKQRRRWRRRRNERKKTKIDLNWLELRERGKFSQEVKLVKKRPFERDRERKNEKSTTESWRHDDDT